MKVCKEGKFATKLESNTIYLGKPNDNFAMENTTFLGNVSIEDDDEGTVSSSHDLIAEYIGNDPAAKAFSRSHPNLNIGGSKTPGKLKNFILEKLSTDLQTED